jgi:hypothetical protein
VVIREPAAPKKAAANLGNRNGSSDKFVFIDFYLKIECKKLCSSCALAILLFDMKHETKILKRKEKGASFTVS